MYEIVINREAQDFFEETSASLQKKLDRCFHTIKITPRYHANIKPLKGELAGYYCYRVGDYRVVYSINEEKKQIIVIVIAHRRQVYE